MGKSRCHYFMKSVITCLCTVINIQNQVKSKASDFYFHFFSKYNPYGTFFCLYKKALNEINEF